ncbi:hypothetical protein L6452_04141 [Arctium lappa]|uniref:Uncharacterized protein n=1 Tax=Arctium lappa TaxID=4217 RepID=A0ACB9FQ61_ARCLA|nr:hypothetical protein L6452_04141 [Arctium lappa]
MPGGDAFRRHHQPNSLFNPSKKSIIFSSQILNNASILSQIKSSSHSHLINYLLRERDRATCRPVDACIGTESPMSWIQSSILSPSRRRFLSGLQVMDSLLERLI